MKSYLYSTFVEKVMAENVHDILLTQKLCPNYPGLLYMVLESCTCAMEILQHALDPETLEWRNILIQGPWSIFKGYGVKGRPRSSAHGCKLVTPTTANLLCPRMQISTGCGSVHNLYISGTPTHESKFWTVCEVTQRQVLQIFTVYYCTVELDIYTYVYFFTELTNSCRFSL